MSRSTLELIPVPFNSPQDTAGTYAGFDRFGRVKDQYWRGYNSTADVDRFAYTYDYAGNPTSRDVSSAIYATNNRDQTYSYDGLNRLTVFKEGTYSSGSISTSPPTFEQDWSLDALGNWANFKDKSSGTTNLDQNRGVNGANEITSITTWQAPAYDAAGNMTTIPTPVALTGGFTATYDAWNRLVMLVDGSSTVAKYEYDGLNRRALKSVYASGALDHKQHFYYNEDWQVLEVRKENSSGTVSGNPLEQFVWHPYYIDAVLCRFYDASTSGTQLQHYYAHDANFNVTSILYFSTVQERYRYSPYGGITVLNASFSPVSGNQTTIGNSITYTGRQFDKDTGLLYYRHRYYHAQLGKFSTRDPIGYTWDSLNLYAYAAQSPIRFVDPSGLSIVDFWNTVKEYIPVVSTIIHCYQLRTASASGMNVGDYRGGLTADDCCDEFRDAAIAKCERKIAQQGTHFAMQFGGALGGMDNLVEAGLGAAIEMAAIKFAERAGIQITGGVVGAVLILDGFVDVVCQVKGAFYIKEVADQAAKLKCSCRHFE